MPDTDTRTPASVELTLAFALGALVPAVLFLLARLPRRHWSWPRRATGSLAPPAKKAATGEPVPAALTPAARAYEFGKRPSEDHRFNYESLLTPSLDSILDTDWTIARESKSNPTPSPPRPSVEHWEGELAPRGSIARRRRVTSAGDGKSMLSPEEVADLHLRASRDHTSRWGSVRDLLRSEGGDRGVRCSSQLGLSPLTRLSLCNISTGSKRGSPPQRPISSSELGSCHNSPRKSMVVNGRKSVTAGSPNTLFPQQRDDDSPLSPLAADSPSRRTSPTSTFSTHSTDAGAALGGRTRSPPPLRAIHEPYRSESTADVRAAVADVAAIVAAAHMPAAAVVATALSDAADPTKACGGDVPESSGAPTDCGHAAAAEGSGEAEPLPGDDGGGISLAAKPTPAKARPSTVAFDATVTTATSTEGSAATACCESSRPSLLRRSLGGGGGGGGRDGSPLSEVLGAVRERRRRFSQLAEGVSAGGSELESGDGDESFVGGAATYDPTTSEIDGFLVDMDGTMYRPGALIPGAILFHEWLRTTHRPVVYLSNTGAKSGEAVRQKLHHAPYRLQTELVPPGMVYTAAEAQAAFMADHIEAGSKVFVVSGGGDFWRGLIDAELLASWDLRTSLSEAEAKQWATIAAAHPLQSLVWVVFFVDGPIGKGAEKLSQKAHAPAAGAGAGAGGGGLPAGGGGGGEHGGEREREPAQELDWSYELISKLSIMLSHGAEFVYTADDAFNPSIDRDFHGYVFPMPGPGMFAEMIKKIMYPKWRDKVHCLGKGGNRGTEYMMEHAIEMLIEQGHSGDRSRIMIVGDRFDTDIRGGLSVGIRTCLVESGCHQYHLQPFYPADGVDFVAESVAALHPLRMSPAADMPMLTDRHISLRIWMLSQNSTQNYQRIDGTGATDLEYHLRQYYASVCASAGKIQTGRLTANPSRNSSHHSDLSSLGDAAQPQARPRPRSAGPIAPRPSHDAGGIDAGGDDAGGDGGEGGGAQIASAASLPLMMRRESAASADSGEIATPTARHPAESPSATTKENAAAGNGDVQEAPPGVAPVVWAALQAMQGGKSFLAPLAVFDGGCQRMPTIEATPEATAALQESAAAALALAPSDGAPCGHKEAPSARDHSPTQAPSSLASSSSSSLLASSWPPTQTRVAVAVAADPDRRPDDKTSESSSSSSAAAQHGVRAASAPLAPLDAKGHRRAGSYNSSSHNSSIGGSGQMRRVGSYNSINDQLRRTGSHNSLSGMSAVREARPLTPSAPAFQQEHVRAALEELGLVYDVDELRAMVADATTPGGGGGGEDGNGSNVSAGSCGSGADGLGGLGGGDGSDGSGHISFEVFSHVVHSALNDAGIDVTSRQRHTSQGYANRRVLGATATARHLSPDANSTGFVRLRQSLTGPMPTGRKSKAGAKATGRSPRMSSRRASCGSVEGTSSSGAGGCGCGGGSSSDGGSPSPEGGRGSARHSIGHSASPRVLLAQRSRCARPRRPRTLDPDQLKDRLGI